MSIKKEIVTINETEYNHTWSDAGMKIQRGDELFDEAFDPVGSGREYIETDLPIISEEDEALLLPPM